MNRDNRYIIRRTISQERFEVLWKKRKNGQATLKDLTEMDEIINRDEGVRQFVLEEMEGKDNPTGNINGRDTTIKPVANHQSVRDKFKAFLKRLLHIVSIKAWLRFANENWLRTTVEVYK
jgi:hypothetical protein